MDRLGDRGVEAILNELGAVVERYIVPATRDEIDRLLRLGLADLIRVEVRLQLQEAGIL